MTHLIEASHLNKVYYRGREVIHALDQVSFSMDVGEMVAIIGPSGSGKTTLVNIIGCLDNPESGLLKINGDVIFKGGVRLSEKKLTLIRRHYFGYIFQKFFLIPTLTVQENILLPSVFYKLNVNEDRVQHIMELLGIAHRARHLPAELSGGEMQRVAIARALITDPQILIADEPTGNLDTHRTEEIKKLFIDLNRKHGIQIIIVTHNPDVAGIADRILEISDGKIKNERRTM